MQKRERLMHLWEWVTHLIQAEGNKTIPKITSVWAVKNDKLIEVTESMVLG